MNVMELLARIGFEADERPLDQINEKLEHIKGRLEFLAAAEVIKGAFELAERFSGVAESLVNTAASAGITTDALQKLQYAASLSGVGADEMQTSMAHLSRSLQAARDGGKEAIAAFAKVGIGPGEIASFKSSGDALSVLADRFHAIGDPIKKQALGMELLGRGSIRMTGFLSKGSKEMEEAGAQADAMGAVISGKTLDSLVEMEDAMKGLGQILKSFGANVAGYFAPSIRDAIKIFGAFYAKYRELIMTHIKTWVDQFLYGLGFVMGVLGKAGEYILDFAKRHETLVHWIGVVVMALGGLSLGVGALGKVLGIGKVAFELLTSGLSPVISVGKVAIAMFELMRGWLVKLLFYLSTLAEAALPAVSEALLSMSAALEATPIGWIVAGIVAFIAVVHDLWAVLHDGKDWKDTWIGRFLLGAKDLFVDITAAIGRMMLHLAEVSGAVDAVKGAWNAVAGAVQAVVPESVQGAVGKAASFAGKALTGQNPFAVGAPGPPMMPAGALARPAAAAGGAVSANYDVSAPVTVNVPAGTAAADVGKAVKDGIRDHLDGVYRDLKRGTATPVAY